MITVGSGGSVGIPGNNVGSVGNVCGGSVGNVGSANGDGETSSCGGGAPF